MENEEVLDAEVPESDGNAPPETGCAACEA
jgi:hypothetical protein